MKRNQVLLLATLILLLAGCSLVQPEKETASEPETDTADTDCEWTTKRGVAELVGFEDNDAVMDFFPGEIRIRTARQAGWQSGKEFKVLIKTPDRPACGAPQLKQIHPLTMD